MPSVSGVQVEIRLRMRSAPIPDITRKNSLALTFPTCVETGLTHYIGVAENKISQRAPQPTVRHDLQPRGEKCGLATVIAKLPSRLMTLSAYM